MKKTEFAIPETGTATIIADDLLWMRFDLPFRLDHVNIYALEGKNGWIFVDSAINTPETEEHWKVLLNGPLSGIPVERIIVTHHHVDHVGFAGPLAAMTGAPVSMSEDEYQFTKLLLSIAGAEFGAILETAYARYALDRRVMDLAKKDHNRFSNFAAPLPAEVEILAEGDVVASKAGEWRVRIDEGHSVAQIGLVDDSRGIYLAGDFLLTRISPNVSAPLAEPDEDRLGSYLEYLADVTSLPSDWLVLPGHDQPFTEGGARAKELIGHHHHRMDLLHEAGKNKAITTADAMEILFSRVFGAHEIMFASGEARAHLTHLVAVGRMERDDSGDATLFRSL